MLKNCVNIFMKTKFLLSFFVSLFFFKKFCKGPKEPPFKNWPHRLDRVCKTNCKTKETDQERGVLNVDPHHRIKICWW